MSRLYTTTRWRRGRLSFLARNPLAPSVSVAAGSLSHVVWITLCRIRVISACSLT